MKMENLTPDPSPTEEKGKRKKDERMYLRKTIYPYTITFPAWTHREIPENMLDEIRELEFVLLADDYLGILRIICKDETVSKEQIGRIEKIIGKYENSQREA